MTKAFVINLKNVPKQGDLRSIRARPRGAGLHSTSTKGKEREAENRRKTRIHKHNMSF